MPDSTPHFGKWLKTRLIAKSKSENLENEPLTENPFAAVMGDVCCEFCRRPLLIDGVTWTRSGEVAGPVNPHCSEHGPAYGLARLWTCWGWSPADDFIAFLEKYS
jgi:hypothetical protein